MEQKVSEAKVTLSDEVGPTLDSLCHRVGLDRVCHADGGACRPGRESTPTGRACLLDSAGGSNSGDASVLTGVIQTNRPKDHASDDHNNHDDHNDHYDDQSRNDDDHDPTNDDDHDPTNDDDHGAQEDETCQSHQTTKGHVPLAI